MAIEASAHPLIFLVGQRLCGSHRDAVTSMNSHRIKILDRTDNDSIVSAVAHHFHFKFFPTDHTFFDQDGMDRAELECGSDQVVELFAVVCDAPACATQRETRSQHTRQANIAPDLTSFIQVVCQGTASAFQADFFHGALEAFSIFCLPDRRRIRPDQNASVLLRAPVS